MAIEQITISDFQKLRDEEEVTLIDIRDADSFEVGHIENALSVNQSNIEEFIESADKEKPLVVCCYHGNSSQGAADFLNSRGFKSTYSLVGGYAAWEAEEG